VSDDQEHPESPQKPPQKAQTDTVQPTLVDVINTVADRADPFVKILEAFAERDIELARSMPPRADEVDGLYNRGSSPIIRLILAIPFA
jgi:hypothetical protein